LGKAAAADSVPDSAPEKKTENGVRPAIGDPLLESDPADKTDARVGAGTPAPAPAPRTLGFVIATAAVALAAASHGDAPPCPNCVAGFKIDKVEICPGKISGSRVCVPVSAEPSARSTTSGAVALAELVWPVSRFAAEEASTSAPGSASGIALAARIGAGDVDARD
jgi:hypothetical protein